MPAELRSKVYEEFFKSANVSNRFTEPVESKRSRRSREMRKQISLKSAPLNLLLSSKRVKNEAEWYFWSSSTFIYTAPPYALRSLPDPSQFDHVQSFKLRGCLLILREILDLLLGDTADGENRTIMSVEVETRLEMPEGKLTRILASTAAAND